MSEKDETSTPEYLIPKGWEKYFENLEDLPLISDSKKASLLGAGSQTGWDRLRREEAEGVESDTSDDGGEFDWGKATKVPPWMIDKKNKPHE